MTKCEKSIHFPNCLSWIQGCADTGASAKATAKHSGGCFIKLIYQISQAYFSHSALFSIDLVSKSKMTIAQAVTVATYAEKLTWSGAG